MQTDEALEWIIGEISGDHTVEVVTDAMLDRMVGSFPHVAVFFYDKDGHEPSDRALEALETIDDDVHDHSEIKVKGLFMWFSGSSKTRFFQAACKVFCLTKNAFRSFGL